MGWQNRQVPGFIDEGISATIQADKAAYQADRAALDLIEYPGQVLSDHAQADHDQAAGKQYCDFQCCETTDCMS